MTNPILRCCFALFLFFLCSCQSTQEQKTAASLSGDDGKIAEVNSGVPRSINVSESVTARKVFNQSFPEIIYTNPAGDYRLDEAKSSKNYLYYLAPSPFKVVYNSGNETNEGSSSGYLVVSRKSIARNSLNPEAVDFSVEHTEKTRSVASNPKKPMSYRPYFDSYTGTGGVNLIRNGNTISFTPNHP